MNCDGVADGDDLLALIGDEGGLETDAAPPCPGIGEDVDGIIWGDVDCDGDVDLDDALAMLLWMAGLPYDALPGCIEIGQAFPI